MTSQLAAPTLIPLRYSRVGSDRLGRRPASRTTIAEMDFADAHTARSEDCVSGRGGADESTASSPRCCRRTSRDRGDGQPSALTRSNSVPESLRRFTTHASCSQHLTNNTDKPTEVNSTITCCTITSAKEVMFSSASLSQFVC